MRPVVVGRAATALRERAPRRRACDDEERESRRREHERKRDRDEPERHPAEHGADDEPVEPSAVGGIGCNRCVHAAITLNFLAGAK